MAEPTFWAKVVQAVTNFFTGQASVGTYLRAALFVGQGVYAQRKALEAKKTGQEILLTRYGTGDSMPVIYGTRRVAGNVVYMNTAQYQKELFVVYAIAGHEIDSFDLETLQIDGRPVSDVQVYRDGFIASDGTTRITSSGGRGTKASGNFFGSTQTEIDNVLAGTNPPNRPRMVFNCHTGSTTQAADPMLAGCINSWTTDHKLTGIAYIACNFEYDIRGQFTGVPNLSVVVNGKKVYDPRSATTAWSANPALCLLDYLTDDDYGKGLTLANDIDSASFNSAANACDTSEATITHSSVVVESANTSSDILVIANTNEADFHNFKIGSTFTVTDGTTTYINNKRLIDKDIGQITDATDTAVATLQLKFEDGGIDTAITSNTTCTFTETQVKFDCHGIVDTQATVLENCKDLLHNMRGIFTYSNGVYSLKVEGAESSVVSLDEDDIFEDGITLSLENKERKYNRVEAQFYNAQKRYEADSVYYTGESSDDFLNDDGELLETRIDLPYCTNQRIAYNHAKALLKRSRSQKSLGFIATPKVLKAEVGEVISITNSAIGLSNALYRITNLTIRPDLNVAVNAIEYQSDIYGYVTPPDESIGVINDPVDGQRVEAPTNLQFTSKDTSTGEPAKLTWTDSTKYPSYEFRVVVKTGNTSTIPNKTRFDRRTKETFFYLDGINIDSGFTAFVSAINTLGVESEATERAFAVTTAPVTTPDIEQGSVGGFNFTATKMYYGTAGNFNNTDTAVYFDNAGQFSLKDKLSWNGTTLNISGNLTVENTITADKIVVDGINLDNLISATTQSGSIYLTEFTGIKIATAGATNGYPALLRMQDDQGTNTFTDITQSQTGINIRARANTAQGTIRFQGIGSGITPVNYGGFDASGNFEIGTTDVIDSSRNLTNIANISTSGDVTITSATPKIALVDNTADSDFSIRNVNGNYRVYDDTNSITRFEIASNGTTTVEGNLAAGNSTNSRFLRAHHSDGSFMSLFGYGLIMNRAASYIRPSADHSYTLYVGGFDASTNADWANIKFRSDNGLAMNGTQFITSARALTNITGITSTGAFKSSGGDSATSGQLLNLAGDAVNQVNSGTIRLTEKNYDVNPFFQGAYIKYNGSTNRLLLGTHATVNQTLSDDVNAIEIARGSTTVDFQGAITTSGNITAGNDINISGNELTFTNDSASAYIRGADALLIQSDYNTGENKPIYLQPSATTEVTVATGQTTFANDVIVSGNLTVNGTTTTLNTATLDVEDKNITLNYGAGDTSASANGAGITIQDAVNSTTDATILWDATNDEFDFSHKLNISGGVTAVGNSRFNGDFQVGDTLNQNAFGAFQVNQTSNVDEEGIAVLAAAGGRSIRIWVDETNSYINSGNGGSGNLIFNEAITVSSGGNLTGVGTINSGAITSSGLVTADELSVTNDSTFNGGLDINGDATFGDNNKAIFGASSDLRIYHDGTQSIITDTGTGQLKILAENTLHLGSATGDEAYIRSLKNGAVTLYYDNSAKLATTSTGIDVGTFTSTGTTSLNLKAEAQHDTKLGLFEDNANYGFSLNYDGGLNDFIIRRHDNSASGVDVLTLNREDNNATFAGDIRANGGDYFTNSGAAGNYRGFGDRLGLSIVNGASYIYDAASTPVIALAAYTGNVHIYNELKMGNLSGTTVIDSSRNLVNIVDATINGEVGIGTTPSSTWKTIIQSQYPLQLKSNTGAATYEFYAQESGTKEFRILNSAKVVGYNQNLVLDTNSANTHVRLNSNGVNKLATTSTGIDVSGSVVSDGLTVDRGSASTTVATFGSDLSNAWLNLQSGADSGVYLGSNAGIFKLLTNTTQRLAVATNGDISFYDDTGSSQALFWDASAERLGIGTTSPISKLHVYSSSGTTPAFTTFNAGNSSDITSFAAHAALQLICYQSEGNPYTKTSALIANADGTVPSEMQFWTKTNGASSAAERLRIDSSGNVGIGTTSPSDKLHVDGRVRTSTSGIALSDTNAVIYRNSNDLELITYGGFDINLMPSNNVGIGTSSPSEKLQVSGAIALTDSIFAEQAGNYTKLYANNGEVKLFLGGADQNNYYDNNGHIFRARNTANELMRINTTGVGIGTASPSEKLSLVGGDLGIYGSTSGGLVTHRTLHFHTSEGTASLSNSNKQVIGEIAFSGHDSSLNAEGKYAHIKSYVIDANNQIQGSANEGGQLEFTILRHDVSTQARVEHTALTIDNSAKVGIGTTDPDGQGYPFAEDLVILGGASASDGVGITLRANGKRYGVIAFGDAADNNAGEIWYDHNANSMNFRTAGTLRATIGSSGNFNLNTGDLKIGDISVITAARNLTNIGTYAGSGSVLVGNTSANFSELTAVGSLELCRTDANGFIDFRSTLSEDYDCRIQQSSNGLIFQTGGNGSTATALTLDSSRNATFAGTISSGAITSSGQVTADELSVTNDSTFNGGIDATGQTITSGAITSSGAMTINEGNAFTDLNIKSDRTSGNIGGVNFVNASNVIKGQVFGNTDGTVYFYSGGQTEALRLDASQNATFAGNITATTGDIQAGSSGNNAFLRAYYGTAYMTLQGYGLEMNRTTSYIRPTTDGNKTLYVGGVDASLDWAAIHFRSLNGLYMTGTRFLTTTRDLENIGTISSTGLVTIDANGNGNTLHIHDDSTGGQPGMVVTTTGNTSTSTQTFYAKQYGSAIGVNLFGQSIGGKAFVGTEGSASGGLLIGTVTADNIWIGTNNTLALTIDSSQNATFAGDVRANGAYKIGANKVIEQVGTRLNIGDVSNSDYIVDITAYGDTSSIVLNDGFIDVVGDFDIAGALSKNSGSFKIDHPLKPETHHLVHSFVEGPQADNLYRGVIDLHNGRATIDLDEWFGMTAGTFLALNRDIQAFVNNEDTWDNVRAKVMGSHLVIECQNSESNAKVSWLVIGERQDKEIHESSLTDNNGKVIVEPRKNNI